MNTDLAVPLSVGETGEITESSSPTDTDFTLNFRKDGQIEVKLPFERINEIGDMHTTDVLYSMGRNDKKSVASWEQFAETYERRRQEIIVEKTNICKCLSWCKNHFPQVVFVAMQKIYSSIYHPDIMKNLTVSIHFDLRNETVISYVVDHTQSGDYTNRGWRKFTRFNGTLLDKPQLFSSFQDVVSDVDKLAGWKDDRKSAIDRMQIIYKFDETPREDVVEAFKKNGWESSFGARRQLYVLHRLNFGDMVDDIMTKTGLHENTKHIKIKITLFMKTYKITYVQLDDGVGIYMIYQWRNGDIEGGLGHVFNLREVVSSIRDYTQSCIQKAEIRVSGVVQSVEQKFTENGWSKLGSTNEVYFQYDIVRD
jgi:hypothetical protein